MSRGSRTQWITLAQGEPRIEYPTKDRPFLRAMYGDEAQSQVHALSTRTAEVLSSPGPKLLMPAPAVGEP